MNTYYATRVEEFRDPHKGRGVHQTNHFVRKWDPETLLLGDEINARYMEMPYKLISASPTVSLQTKSAAVLTRQILKDRFPETKFSVRVQFYAGGSSINIRWTGGPTTREVSEPLNALTGRGFDPMTDSTTSSDHLIAWAGKIYKPCFAFINCNRQEHPDPEATAGDFPWEFGDIHP